jgi:hypothetical protein
MAYFRLLRYDVKCRKNACFEPFSCHFWTKKSDAAIIRKRRHLYIGGYYMRKKAILYIPEKFVLRFVYNPFDMSDTHINFLGKRLKTDSID